MPTFKQQLEVVRQYTGDAFRTARGYDARKAPSFGRRMAVLKYYRKIAELTAVETVTYVPKKGTKTEAFNYTGQSGFRKFTKAIVRKISPDQKLTFEIDKSKPRGHRFVAVDAVTGRRYYNLPAHLFDADEIDAGFYADVIEQYAEDAQYFLINSGETYMWGSGGQRNAIAGKLAAIFNNYSATNFDVNDKNSSYYGNWFKGVTGFTSRFDVLPRVGEARRKRREYREKFHMDKHNYRRLNDGNMGKFLDGELLSVTPMTWDKSDNAYNQGYHAFRALRMLSDNPYLKNSSEWRQWRHGYRDAKAGH